jgi:hypothetical protein
VQNLDEFLEPRSDRRRVALSMALTMLAAE